MRVSPALLTRQKKTQRVAGVQNDEKSGFHRTIRRTDRRVTQQSTDEDRGERERERVGE